VVRPENYNGLPLEAVEDQVVLVDRARPLGVDGAQAPVLTGGVAPPHGGLKGHDDFVMTQPQLPVTIQVTPGERP
jgi:hypothetical protein